MKLTNLNIFFIRSYIINLNLRFIRNSSKLSKFLIFLNIFLLNIDRKILKFIYLFYRHKKFINIKKFSKSYNFEDVIALYILSLKKNGFFLEAGALDGVLFSNTFLLEKKFGWNGVLIEPVKSHFLKIKKFRRVKSFNFLLGKKNSKSFIFENLDKIGQSTHYIDYVKNYSYIKRSVNQRSLNYIFKKNNLNLDYVDVCFLDIEFAEIEVLKNFNFSLYCPKIFCIEVNNNDSNMKKLDQLMEKKYSILFKNSQLINKTGSRWYINKKIAEEINFI